MTDESVSAPRDALLLGVDAGGTTTRSVLLDMHGHCHGYGRGVSGNPTAVGPAAAASAVVASVAAALESAGVRGPRVASVVLAMAGATTTSPVAELRHRLAELAVEAPIHLEGDLLATYFSGTSSTTGYALVAGTGAAAVRVEQGRVAATSDGLGWLLGDAGSAFWIGRRVVRAALADLDGRGPATLLTGLLLDRLGLDIDTRSGPDGSRAVLYRALEILYADRPVRLARYAPLAFAAAGDRAADRIMAEAVAELADTVTAIVSPGVRGPLVLGGGLLTHQPAVARQVVAALAAREVVPPQTHPVEDGVVGAAMLALRHAGVRTGPAILDQVRDSLARLR